MADRSDRWPTPKIRVRAPLLAAYGLGAAARISNNWERAMTDTKTKLIPGVRIRDPHVLDQRYGFDRLSQLETTMARRF
jgi:hypothetical protein